MKVDRVVLVWDGNSFYDGFYEMQTKLWDKLGIKTGLVYISDGTNASKIPSHGDIVVIEDKSTVPFTPPPGRNWKATMGIIHGPTLFPNEVIMVTGMDQMPASYQFIGAVEKIPEGVIATPIGSKKHTITNHIVAHHREWCRVMAPAPSDFTELLHWTWEKNYNLAGYAGIATGWGNDEVLLAHLLRESDVEVVRIFEKEWEDWLQRVLGITNIDPDPEKLRQGFYSELHIRLPLSDLNRRIYNQLLEMEPFPGKPA